MILSTPLPPGEGIGHYCSSLGRELVRQGHRVTLITRGGRVAKAWDDPNGYRVVAAPFFPAYPFHVHLHGLFLDRIVRELEPETDVFHLHSPLVPVIGTSKPVVVTVHTPMLADVGALEPIGPLAYLARAQAPISVRLERALLRRADAVAAVANSVSAELADYGLAPDQVAVLGNGTDPEFFTPAEPEPRSGASSILYAGRLAHRKGLLDLLEAFKLLRAVKPQVVLTLAGSGPLETELRQRAARHGLAESVRFLGHLTSREDLREAYRSATVYVQPSHYEGLPTSLIEAMSCALPVVATRVSGHLDIVEPDRNGLLVSPKSPQGLADALAHLIGQPKKACALGTAARQTVVDRFAWPQIAERYRTLYQQVLS